MVFFRIWGIRADVVHINFISFLSFILSSVNVNYFPPCYRGLNIDLAWTVLEPFPINLYKRVIKVFSDASSCFSVSLGAFL